MNEPAASGRNLEPDSPHREGETQLEYLYRLIDERLAARSGSARWFRKTNLVIQMATTVLSAVITVVAGLKSFGLSAERASDFVLVLGAIVTVIAAYGAFYSPRLLWVADSQTSNRFTALQAKLRFHQRAEDFELRRRSILDAAFEEYQAICAEHNEVWRKIRSPSS